ncbi:MAG TPA: hypothetical protein VNG51_11760 [Ktedonobacteraceae bacterium]|nr:hypothetical protein [Ktedonobacteraceae bacterium]
MQITTITDVSFWYSVDVKIFLFDFVHNSVEGAVYLFYHIWLITNFHQSIFPEWFGSPIQ